MSKEELEKEIYFLESMYMNTNNSNKQKKLYEEEINSLHKKLTHLNSVRVKESYNESNALNG